MAGEYTQQVTKSRTGCYPCRISAPWLICRKWDPISQAKFWAGRSSRSALSGYRDWDAARLARERPRCPVPNQPPGDRFFRARRCVPPSCCYGVGQLRRGSLWGPSGGKIRKIRTFPLGDFIELASVRLRERSLAGSQAAVVAQFAQLGCLSALPRRRGIPSTKSAFRSTRARGGRLGQSCPRANASTVCHLRTSYGRRPVLCESGSPDCFTAERNSKGRPQAAVSASPAGAEESTHPPLRWHGETV